MDFGDSTWGLDTREVWEAALKEFKANRQSSVQKTFTAMRAAVLKLVTASEATRFGHFATAHRSRMPRKTFLEEYHVVQVGSGRQSGKTEVIIQLAQNEDLIITYNSNFREDIQTRLQAHRGERIPLVVTVKDFQAHLSGELPASERPLANKQFPRIWMDESSMLFMPALRMYWSDFVNWVLAAHPALLPTIIRMN